MSTALRKEVREFRRQLNLRASAKIPEDRVEFAHQLGIVPDPWQRDVLQSDSPRILMNIARQVGKSTTAAILALHGALHKPGTLVLVMAPAERQAKETLGKVLQFYSHLQFGHASSYRKLGLELQNGSRIEALPGTEKTIRGFSGVDLLILDEASRIDDALYYSVRPMLAVSGGRLVMMSTPAGKRGIFYDEWTDGSGWERYQVTADQCPRISDEFLEAERRLPSYWFEQEYLCVFHGLSNSVFNVDDVHAAVTPDVESFKLPGDELW